MQLGMKVRWVTDPPDAGLIDAPSGMVQLRVLATSATRTRQWLDSAVIAFALLALAGGSVLTVFWPGIIRWDSAQMIVAARRGVANNWWSGIGTVLLHGWLSMGLGLPLVWLAIVVANILGLFGCVRLVMRRVPAAVVTLAFVLFPPIYGQLAGLSRDSARVGFALLAFAALATIVRNGGRRRRRLLAAAFACATLTAACRQNGMTTVGAVALFAVLYGRHPTKRTIAAGVAAALVAAVATYAGLQGVGSLMGVRSVHPERATFVYDLAAMSADTGRDQFPQPQLQRLAPGGAAPSNTSEPVLRRRFQAWDVTSLRTASEWAAMDVNNVKLATAENTVLRTAWIRSIEHDPLAYLKDRLTLYEALLGLSGEPRKSPIGFFFAYDGLESPSNYGYPLAFPQRYRAATNVLGLFIGNHASLPLDRAWSYFLLIAVGLAVLRWKRSPAVLLVTSMCFGLALNQLLLFFTVMSAAFRYEFFATPKALLCIVYGLAAIASARPTPVPEAIRGR
jgi:hypothetical protein